MLLHTLSILATATQKSKIDEAAAERRPVCNLDCYCFVSGLSLSTVPWLFLLRCALSSLALCLALFIYRYSASALVYVSVVSGWACLLLLLSLSRVIGIRFMF